MAAQPGINIASGLSIVQCGESGEGGGLVEPAVLTVLDVWNHTRLTLQLHSTLLEVEVNDGGDVGKGNL